jgi:hypothetical protein
MKWPLPLAAAVLLAGCTKAPVPGARIDPALAGLIPADTVMLAGVHADALQKTTVYVKHLADRSFPLLDDFMTQTGLKRREDLWELLYISNGKQSVLLGRGKFSDEAEPDLKRPGAKRFGYKGVTLVGDDQTAVMLVSPTVLGVGETPALKSLIDNKGQSNGPPAALAERMKEIPPEAAFWAAYTGGPVSLPQMPGNFANLNKVMSTIQTGLAYLDLRTALNGLATGICATEQNANELQTALQGLVGVGRMMAPKNQPEMAKVFDGLRVTVESRKVNVHIDEPEELLDTVLNLAVGRRRPAN